MAHLTIYGTCQAAAVTAKHAENSFHPQSYRLSLRISH